MLDARNSIPYLLRRGRGPLGFLAIAIGIGIAIERPRWIRIPQKERETALAVPAPVPGRKYHPAPIHPRTRTSPPNVILSGPPTGRSRRICGMEGNALGPQILRLRATGASGFVYSYAGTSRSG